MSYKTESEALVEKYSKCCSELENKYKDQVNLIRGLGISPHFKELDKLTKEFSAELKALKQKYNLKTKEDIQNALKE